MPCEVDALILQTASKEFGGAQAGLLEIFNECTQVVESEGAQACHVGQIVGLRDSRGAGIQQRCIWHAVL